MGKFNHHIGRSRHNNGRFSHRIGRSRHHNGDHIGKFSHRTRRSRHHNGDHIGKFSHRIGRSGHHVGKFTHHIVRSRHHNGDHIGKFSHHIVRSRHHNGDHIGKFKHHITLGDPVTTMGTALGNSAPHCEIQTPQWVPHWEIQRPHFGRSRHGTGLPATACSAYGRFLHLQETSCLFALAKLTKSGFATFKQHGCEGRNGPPGNGL